MRKTKVGTDTTGEHNQIIMEERTTTTEKS